MARKVAESHSVAYFNDPDTLAAFGLDEEGFYVIEDKVSEKSDHVNDDGEEYSVRHESNPEVVRRVFPAADGEGWVYEAEETEEEGDES